MMLNHSPAPWRIVRSSDYTDDPEDTTIQSIEAADGKSVYYTESGYFKPREDDARLIEKSPELLAFIRAIQVSEGPLIWSRAQLLLSELDR